MKVFRSEAHGPTQSEVDSMETAISYLVPRLFFTFALNVFIMTGWKGVKLSRIFSRAQLFDDE